MLKAGLAWFNLKLPNIFFIMIIVVFLATRCFVENRCQYFANPDEIILPHLDVLFENN